MKYILLALMMIVGKVASADIIVHKDTVGGYYYCDITPIVCQVGSDTVSRLSFTNYGGNGIDESTIAYMLRSPNGITQCVGNLTLSGTNYAAYRAICEEGDTMNRAKFIYNYISNQIPQIQPVE